MVKNPTYLYLIVSEDQKVAKIGRTNKRPNVRLSQLQTGNVSKLSLYAAVCAEPEAEPALHGLLAKYKVQREWFKHVHMLKRIFCELEEDEWGPVNCQDRCMTADEVCASAEFAIRSFVNDKVNGLYAEIEDDALEAA